MRTGIARFSLIAAAAWTMAGIQGCMWASSSMPAEQAFALSASALSGTESYGFVGKIAVYDPGGRLGSQSAFEGQVNGHGNLKINWNTDGAAAESSEGKPAGANRPLKLLETLSGRNAAIAYDEPPSPDQPVRFRIKLDEETAKSRIADGLREEMALLREDSKRIGPQSASSGEALDNADKKLEAALSTLKVETIVLWTANPKDWFPLRMKEETVLSYSWEGNNYREKRTSETDFLAKG